MRISQIMGNWQVINALRDHISSITIMVSGIRKLFLSLPANLLVRFGLFSLLLREIPKVLHRRTNSGLVYTRTRPLDLCFWTNAASLPFETLLPMDLLLTIF